MSDKKDEREMKTERERRENERFRKRDSVKKKDGKIGEDKWRERDTKYVRESEVWVFPIERDLERSA